MAEYADELAKYEEAIGASAEKRWTGALPDGADKPWVVISDTHLPNVRRDLLATICRRHKGCNVIVAGDVLDNGRFSRWPKTDTRDHNVKEALASRDALASYLRRYFDAVKLLEGNHDARFYRNAAQLGADYYYATQEFFRSAFQQRHGVELVQRRFESKDAQRHITLAFFEQIGDCVIGHVERSGATPMRGGRIANDFFQKWRGELGLTHPWRVLLQAHTHHRGYWFDPVTQVHCYETGALCDNPSYAIEGHRGDPIQHGYYLLVQKDGVTDLHKSRQFIL